ncbi:MAG: type VI secretion system lipoprotein TssJ [Burkholderiaceae bacterium]|nr:type VI secretion system lipoprotein TssJ [Burkholderiaceae bacterium]
MTATRLPHLPDSPGRRDCLLAALGCTLTLFTGCASKEVVTPVSLNLIASADANPDARGRASPLAVRLYVLKSSSAFSSADFFSLYDKDSATLGADLLQREEALLRPGETKVFDFSLKPDARAIGVIAAYRDLEHARWRELRALDVGKPSRLNLLFEARQIRIVQR